MILANLISWRKEYYEDLGEKDENGYFDYAYRYFIYTFYLPNNGLIIIRQYTDSLTECALYICYDYQGGHFNREPLSEIDYVSDIISFMRKKDQGITNFSRFNGKYVPINMSELRVKKEGTIFVENTSLRSGLGDIN
jgi:hypothetical protein